jgi:hypothetical protein
MTGAPARSTPVERLVPPASLEAEDRLVAEFAARHLGQYLPDFIHLLSRAHASNLLLALQKYWQLRTISRTD